MSDTTRVTGTVPGQLHIRRLDEICDAFESAWTSGDTPVVEKFLGDVQEPDRTELLSELIRVDVHYRRQAGETPTPADYAHRFPTLSPAFWSRAIGAPQSHVGAVLNGYQLKEEIGHGGMGRVYRASHPRLEQDVALKVLQPGMDSAPIVGRFDAERQTLARMDHPHISRVFDGGVTDDGRPFFVMELVRGVPVNRYCAEQKLGLRQRMELFIAVCQGVQHAHQKGIIHRDLKPSNVLIAEYDGKPTAKIIDFGIARATDRRATLRTEAGMLVGTPEYMSPEQADPQTQDIDTRSDVYSLGVILYELLVGETPFARRQPNVQIYELLRMIREVEPLPPSQSLTSSPREQGITVKEVRGELDWITLKCLEKDPARRYQTADALAEDIQRFLADEPVLAGPPSRTYRLRKFVRRHRVPVIAAACILVALIGGIVGTTLGMVRADRATADKQTALDELEIEQQRVQDALVAEKAAFNRANSTLETLTDEAVERLMARQDNLSKADRAFLLKIMSEYEALAETRGDSKENRSVRARGLVRVASLQHRLGHHAEAAVGYQEARDMFRRLTVEYPAEPVFLRQLGVAQMELGHCYADSARFAEADTELRAAHAAFQRLCDDFPKNSLNQENLAISLIGRGNIANSFNRPAEAVDFFNQAVALFQAIESSSPNSKDQKHHLVLCHTNLGSTLQKLKQPDAARMEYSRSIDLLEKQLAGADADPRKVDSLVLAYLNRATLGDDSPDASSGEADYHQALRIGKKLVADYPGVTRYRKRLATAHSRYGVTLEGHARYQDAESEHIQALALRKQLVADFPDETEFGLDAGGTFCNLGNLHRIQNEPSESLDWYAQAIQVLTPVADRVGAKTNARRFLSNSHHGRALSLQKLERYADAIRDWDRVVELSDAAQREANRLRRAACMARVSPEKAAAEVDEVMQNKNASESSVYSAAAVYALASEHAAQTDLRESYAGRAVALLHVAQSKGLFKDPSRVKLLQSDPQFTSLRTRADFLELLAKIAAPAAQ